MECQDPEAQEEGKAPVQLAGPSATFACRLDDRRGEPCTSPFVEKVRRGKHVFEVYATDVAGNPDPTPPTHEWKLKRKRPWQRTRFRHVDARPITFLSDYGYEDEFAGVCRAVIARVAPEARLIDLTHGIPRHDVRRGALTLADALPYVPAGVHLAVIDPGVGTERRAVAIRVATEDRVLVGPDNGLLWPAVEVLGGALEAVDLDRSPFRLEPVSATFHGRDLFAPSSAALALGTALAEVGHAVEPSSLTRLDLPSPRSEPDRLAVNVLHLDRFGNATLSAGARDLPGGTLRPGHALSVEVGGRSLGATLARTFADVGEGDVLVFEDSSGRLALAVNRGSAAEMLEVAPGDEVAIVVAR